MSLDSQSDVEDIAEGHASDESTSSKVRKKILGYLSNFHKVC